LIVIAKHKDIESCLLSNLNGNLESNGIKFILGINIFSPIFFACDHCGRNNVFGKMINLQSCPITKTIFLIDISQKHDRYTNFMLDRYFSKA